MTKPQPMIYTMVIDHGAIAKLMRFYKAKHRLTLREMAPHFDISYTAIKRLADGREQREMGIRMLAVIADKFEVPINTFYYLMKTPI